MNFTQKLVTKAVEKKDHEQDEGRGREAKGGGERKEIKKTAFISWRQLFSHLKYIRICIPSFYFYFFTNLHNR